jgi:hypothetical protein
MTTLRLHATEDSEDIAPCSAGAVDNPIMLVWRTGLDGMRIARNELSCCWGVPKTVDNFCQSVTPNFIGV